MFQMRKYLDSHVDGASGPFSLPSIGQVLRGPGSLLIFHEDGIPSYCPRSVPGKGINFFLTR